MSVLITGGTGWIGRHLLPGLTQPTKILTRNKSRASERMSLPESNFVECDLSNGIIDPRKLDDVDSVVNLMGDSIADGRWTKEKKERIRNSRVVGTSHLVHSLLGARRLPRVVVSASAVGIYGEQGDTVIDESFPPGRDFLSQVSHEWEQAMQPLIEKGVRVCFLRIGIVLGNEGGALKKMMPPFKMGLGGKLGSGQQWMSWIHMHDLVDQILFLLNNDHLVGAFNGTAPQPVRNIEFTKTLGRALGRPSFFSVPGFALQIAVGEFAKFLLASQRVAPKAFETAGFEFLYPDLKSALEQITR